MIRELLGSWKYEDYSAYRSMNSLFEFKSVPVVRNQHL